MSCAVCRRRKGKRACPARGEGICSQCCGTKRLVEIDCPSDCLYLTGAHAPGWEGRAADRQRDERRLGPYVGELSERQAHLVLIALAGLGALRARHGNLDDTLVREAVVAVRKTAETRGRGVLYEHPPGDARADGLVQELAGVFEARGEDGALHRPSDRDLVAALRALEKALTGTIREGEGPHAFLDSAARLVARLGGRSAAPRPRPLIVEP
ncbi:MAG: hypothetical protein LJF30_08390 [Acidobacteria bacterium]|nr:hypothetical protein [Acidobacteriota bacterium]